MTLVFNFIDMGLIAAWPAVWQAASTNQTSPLGRVCEGVPAQPG